MAWIGPVIGGALSAFGAIEGQNSANSANIGLNRTNRNWQEQMANTAVQRKMADLKMAGLNPALAAAGGGADTPSTAPPTVESNTRDAAHILGNTASQAIQGMQAKANIDLTRASTAKELALARSANVEAANNEMYGPKLAELGLNRSFEASEQANMQTEIQRLTRDLTASQVEQFKRSMPSVVAQLENQAKQGKLEVESLEGIKNLGGPRAYPFIKLIFDALTTAARGH